MFNILKYLQDFYHSSMIKTSNVQVEIESILGRFYLIFLTLFYIGLSPLFLIYATIKQLAFSFYKKHFFVGFTKFIITNHYQNRTNSDIYSNEFDDVVELNYVNKKLYVFTKNELTNEEKRNYKVNESFENTNFKTVDFVHTESNHIKNQLLNITNRFIRLSQLISLKKYVDVARKFELDYTVIESK